MKILILSLFGLGVVIILMMFGNNLRCLSTDGACPQLCRQREQVCALKDSAGNCLSNSGCRAPSYSEYLNDLKAWWQNNF